MTCPRDNRPCAAPRCAVCPMVELSEAEALPALFAVAALTGGFVNELLRFHPSYPLRMGYAVMSSRTWPANPRWAPAEKPLWVWLRGGGLFGPMEAADLAVDVRPGGRIDRGLNAIHPGTKIAPETDALSVGNRGDQAPTD